MPAGASIGNLTYHGGAVQHTQKIFTIFWDTGTPFPSGYQTTINQFVQDLDNTPYYALASQYSDSGGNISPHVVYGGTWHDATNALPETNLTLGDLSAEVSRATAANGWTSDANSYFQIYTPSGYASAASGVCGLHWFASPAIGHILYPVSGCLPESPYPNNSIVDAAINVSAHEIMETATDPLGNAWYFVNASGEMGDECNFNFGTRASDGSNVTLNGHKYVIQQEWSNAVSGCALNSDSALLTTPPPGATISGTVNFGWTAGSGASQYWFYVGTTGVGSANIFNASTGTTQAATVPGVPASGTIYVRLWTLLPTGWAFNDYTYTGGELAAVLTTPPPGATISGTVNFGWSSGIGASQYWFYVGTTGVGSANTFNASTGTTQAATVPGVPASGTIYVRLWTLLPTGWAFHDYTYVGGVQTPAVLTTPTPGTTISGAVTFGWTAGIGASQYWLYVGTSGVGSTNIFSASTASTQSATVPGVPASGTIYVRLWTLLSTGWAFHDYTYVGGVPTAAAITTPAPGTTLAGSTATFGWNAGVGISQYWLYVGTTGVGSANIFNASTGVAQSASVTGLPTSGTIDVRLWSLTSNGWQFRDYTYTGGVAQPGVLTTPLPGSVLSGSSEPFAWNSGHGASQYWLYVGTTGVASADIYNKSAGLALSATVTGVPTTGTIYVRLWTLLPTGWTFGDYTYTGGFAAAMTMPPPGTMLSGSAVTFDWNSVTAASQYWLSVGTTGVGSANVYSASAGLALSTGVTGIPTSGTLYVRLWTLAGSWRSNDYTYTGGEAGAMTTPIPGSMLSSSTATFGWDTGTGVDQYWLYVGTTGVGSTNIFSSSAGVTLSATVTGLPTSDTMYVRLWSHLAGGWVWNDYRYTGRGAAALEWPVPGTTLSGSSATFDWDAGNGASQYGLFVGTTGVGSSDIYAATGTNPWATVSAVPTSGTVYVRVWTLLPTGWTFNDYTYTGGSMAAAGGTAPQ